MPILEINNLNIKFKTIDGMVHVVNNVSFSVNAREMIGLVGESGSGKTQTVLAVMGLLAKNAIVSGSIKFMGLELVGLDTQAFNLLRGNKIAMIFQDPMTSLNPYLTIKSQMVEVLLLHKKMTYKEALFNSIKMLDFVRIPDAKNRINLYPHEFSGGMRQRIMIAISLLCKPQLLIADEPTTALDVTVQAQILQILKDLQQEFGMSVIVITHDMGVVANLCSRVNVMYAGNIMENGSVEQIFYTPKHPYTCALLNSIPRLEKDVKYLATISGEPLNLMNLPVRCVFQDLCNLVDKKCRSVDMLLQKLVNDQLVKCNLQF